MCTINITSDNREINCWVSGSAVRGNGETVYFEAKVYDLGSEYGIDDGRVSKLWIKDVYSYDRGDEEFVDERDELATRLLVEAIVEKLEQLPKFISVH